MDVKIEQLSREELEKRGVFGWPIWIKEVSSFPWSYDSVEECYILEGEVEVWNQEGKVFKFGKGDFVTFPQGLSCTWNIKTPVRKHYNFR